MRLMLSCVSAEKFPTTIVTTATIIRTPPSGIARLSTPLTSSRRKAPKAATLTVVAMKVVTGGGDPSYTSGTHMWNGAAPILKQKPATRKSVPRCRRWLPCAAASDDTTVVPVAPQTSDTPYRKSDDANEPRTKYLSADSFDLTSVRRKAQST